MAVMLKTLRADLRILKRAVNGEIYNIGGNRSLFQ